MQLSMTHLFYSSLFFFRRHDSFLFSKFAVTRVGILSNDFWFLIHPNHHVIACNLYGKLEGQKENPHFFFALAHL